MPRALVAAGVNRALAGGAGVRPGPAAPPGPPAPAGATSPSRGPRGARRGDRIGLGGPAVRRAGPGARCLGGDAGRGDRPGRGPRVRVRPHARRPGRGGDHRTARRPPADDARGRGAGGRRRSASRTRTRPRPSTRSRWTGWRRAGFRGYEISNWAPPGPREPPQPRLLAAPSRTRPSVPGRTRSTVAVRRWNAARLDGYLRALAPAGTGGSVAPARRRRARGRRRGGGRGRHPRAPPRRRPAVSWPAAGRGPARVAAERGPLAPHLALGPGAGS